MDPECRSFGHFFQSQRVIAFFQMTGGFPAVGNKVSFHRNIVQFYNGTFGSGIQPDPYPAAPGVGKEMFFPFPGGFAVQQTLCQLVETDCFLFQGHRFFDNDLIHFPGREFPGLTVFEFHKHGTFPGREFPHNGSDLPIFQGEGFGFAVRRGAFTLDAYTAEEITFLSGKDVVEGEGHFTAVGIHFRKQRIHRRDPVQSPVGGRLCNVGSGRIIHGIQPHILHMEQTAFGSHGIDGKGIGIPFGFG